MYNPVATLVVMRVCLYLRGGPGRVLTLQLIRWEERSEQVSGIDCTVRRRKKILGPQNRSDVPERFPTGFDVFPQRDRTTPTPPPLRDHDPDPRMAFDPTGSDTTNDLGGHQWSMMGRGNWEGLA